MNKVIYTIGHSDHDPKTFIGLLEKYKIQALIDVRSSPYSSYVKHFNKEILKNFLYKHRIDYFYGGQYMGGKPSDETIMRDGKIDFELLRKKESYQKGLKVLQKLINLKIVVIMCSEEAPEKCHRTKLIIPDLLNAGYEVRNIRSDGSYEVAQLPPVQLEIPPKEIQSPEDITTL
ncbi:DUF488 domain-containing protein [bacterium]|nr:DUF488 domain-containing protein [bacterium]MBU1024564.1 DUF488 domain-containing protein [bacterium]